MEMCKVPTLRLKVLNKHTHIMYIEMENVIHKLLFFNCLHFILSQLAVGDALTEAV